MYYMAPGDLARVVIGHIGMRKRPLGDQHFDLL